MERGTNGKTPPWRKEEVQEQGNREEAEAEAAGYFLVKKKDEARTDVKQRCFLGKRGRACFKLRPSSSKPQL